MKKIIALLVLILATAALVPVEAQNVNVNININIDKQPAWGPVGYRYVDFYYFPDLNIYYDVNYGMFYYSSRGRWVSSRYLPAKYSRYDLYGMYKVVINERHPWQYNRVHRKEYARYKNNRTQVVIRHSTDNQYQRSRNNTVSWVEDKPSTKRTSSRTSTSTTNNSNSRNSSRSSSAVSNDSRNSTGSSSATQNNSSRSNNSSSSSSSRSSRSSR